MTEVDGDGGDIGDRAEAVLRRLRSFAPDVRIVLFHPAGGAVLAEPHQCAALSEILGRPVVTDHLLSRVGPAHDLVISRAWTAAQLAPDGVAECVVELEGEGTGTEHHVWIVDLRGVGHGGTAAVALPTDEPASTLPPPPESTPGGWRRASTMRLRLDGSGRILEASDGAREVLGREPSELVGLQSLALIHPDDHTMVLEGWLSLLDEPGGRRTIRHRIGSPERGWRWHDATSHNRLHEPAGVVLVRAVDVTDSVQVELGLRESEEQFRTLAEALPTGVLVARAGRVLFANRQLKDIVGVPPDTDATSFDWDMCMDFLHPDDRALVDGLKLELPFEQAGEVIPVPMRIVRRNDGTVRDVRVRFRLVDIGHGPTAIASIEDVTARVASRREQARLAEIIEHSYDLVVVTHRNAGVVQANAAVRRLFGDVVIGHPARTMLTEASRALLDDEAMPALISAGTWRGELEIEPPGRSPMPVSALLQTHADGDDPAAYISGVLRDISDQRLAADRLAQLARRDALTGLPNRLAIVDLLTASQDDDGEGSSGLTVLFIDLDNLKVVNDSLGHRAGDELLCEVARRMEAVLRDQDVIGRFGGDEFVVVCPDTTRDEHALALANRLLAAVAEPIDVGGSAIAVTASVGIAIDPDGTLDADALIRDADAAMYVAKRRGKNGVSLFDERLRHRADRRLGIESELRRALAADHLRVELQGIHDLRTGRMLGVEALARWEIDGEPMSPEEFVAVAEESGLIVPLGYRALELACEAAALVRHRYPERDDLFFGVNVSMYQFSDPFCATRVHEVVAASGVPADRMMLEITESAFVGHLPDAEQGLRELHATGLRIGIDDFGTGFTSLSYLRHLPVDELKFDASYVRELTTNRATAVMVAAITAMAQRLDMTVVAEGVETEMHRVALLAAGVTCGQGYLLGRAVPAEDLDPGHVPDAFAGDRDRDRT